MATAHVRPKTCSINGCQGKVYALGWCLSHYNRNRRNGHPLAGKPTGWGEVRRWLEQVAIPFESDDCLMFPFFKNEDGYGKVRDGGKVVGAHVFVALRVIGPKSNPTDECRHSCGNGHLGCVNARHLRWGTHTDNMADAVAHGTARTNPRYGADHHMFKVDDEMVEAILRDLSAGMPQKEISRKYRIGQSHVSRINKRVGRFARWPAITTG